MSAFLLDAIVEDEKVLTTSGFIVHDLTNAVDNIVLDVVPGRGLTYNGFDTMEECLDHIEPSIRACSPAVRYRFAQFAKRVLGFASENM